jgi:magnesium chelatase subunit D
VTAFPFTGVVGQDDARLALVLAAIDPAIGGVLLRGDKGSAKSTLARGLAAVLPGSAPFVELPIGATEDAVVGSLDLGAAMAGEGIVARPGLLARAHGGVLYVDEVNLLPDHLVDVVLDAAASGRHRLERDGVSVEQDAQFVLVGSMNPEEGELRPQLLDRFGLVVELKAPSNPAVRAEAVRARLAFDAGAPTGTDAELAGRLAAVQSGAVPSEVVDLAVRLALSVGAEGLRADLVLCRAAAALAGWEGRAKATGDDVERVAPFVLAHRRRRRPFDPPSMPPEELQQAIEQAKAADGDADLRWGDVAGDAAERPVAVPKAPTSITGPLARGPVIGHREPEASGPHAVAPGPTVMASLRRGSGRVEAEDVREPVRREPLKRCIVLAVDTSGSMAGKARAEAATGAVLGLLADAYRGRHEVALVAFHGGGAEVVLPPTASVELARARLTDLPAGGSTPLFEGLEKAYEVARRASAAPFVVIVTDGRATAGAGAIDKALAFAAEVAPLRIDALVLDAEDGPTRLGLARRLADALGARCVPLGEVSADSIRSAIGA